MRLLFVFWGRNPPPKLGGCRNDHCFSLLKRQSVSQWWCYFIALDLFWVRAIRHASWQLFPPPHGAEKASDELKFSFFLPLFPFLQRSYYRDSANDTDDDTATTTDPGHSEDVISSAPTTSTSDEEVEIPIWIRGEPRFVAGINEATTCNNIIQALIDDELQSGNYKKGKRFGEKRWGVTWTMGCCGKWRTFGNRL